LEVAVRVPQLKRPLREAMVQTVARLIFTPMLAIIYRQQLVVVEAQAQALPVNLVLPVVRVVVVVVHLTLHQAAQERQGKVILAAVTTLAALI